MKVAILSEYSPRNVMLSQEDYIKIYPKCIVSRRLTILFPRNITEIYVEEEIAMYLTRKYRDITIKGIDADAMERITENMTTLQEELGIIPKTVAPEITEPTPVDNNPKKPNKPKIIDPFSDKNNKPVAKDELLEMKWMDLQKRAAELGVYDKKLTRSELIERMRAINEKG